MCVNDTTTCRQIVDENRGKFYLSPTVCQHLVLSFTHKFWVCWHELANISLTYEGRLSWILELKRLQEKKSNIPVFIPFQVRYLKIIEKSGYQALPWVRYITQNGGTFVLLHLRDKMFVFNKFALLGITALFGLNPFVETKKETLLKQFTNVYQCWSPKTSSSIEFQHLHSLIQISVNYVPPPPSQKIPVV